MLPPDQPALSRISYIDPEAAAKFSQSLHETGFAVLSHPPLDPELVQAVYTEWVGFFDSDQKYCYTFDPQSQRGFFPFQSEHAKDCDRPDLKEFFHLYPGQRLPAGISDRTWELFHALIQLGQELLIWIAACCPLEIQQQFSQPLSQMTANSPENLLRLLHYPAVPSDRAINSLRAAPHEDVNLLTLLPAATETGLEIRDNQGKWYSVPSDRGDLVVNVGDMLQLASCGYYRSTTHRVVNPQGEAAKMARYSMPLFLHPRPEVILQPGMTARAFLEQRLREIGLLADGQSRD